MKSFYVALALVVGLLLPERSFADATGKFCVYPKADAVEMLDKMQKEHGYKIKVLKGLAAQAYLDVLRQFTEIPELPGIELHVIYNEGAGAFVVAIKGENRCGHTAVSWPIHNKAMIAAERTNV
jgi:hypothetical protein